MILKNKAKIIKRACAILWWTMVVLLLLLLVKVIGAKLSGIWQGFALIPISMLLGYFIVKAEPSVYVLKKLVEQMSAGAIAGKTVELGLSIGVSAALGLAALRIIIGVNILWFLIPGYVLALGLSFFVPKIFVGIAFDSGGVASGTMMSAFVLPLCLASCNILGGNVMTDAFGCVAFVAMAPIISIQILGLVYRIKTEVRVKSFVSRSESFIDYGYNADTDRQKTLKARPLQKRDKENSDKTKEAIG